MIERPFWVEQVERAWRRAPIVWLTGVRRVGKTTLSKHWDGTVFLNCDLPRNRNLLTDPEHFFSQVATNLIVLDEIHRIENPSEVLKIAADEFPQLKILATGSSTLAATRKFRDSLTGRKRVVHLTPVLMEELPRFGNQQIKARLLRGGLPDCLLSEVNDPGFYSEWLDSFFARDVQELFTIGKRGAFLKLCELLLRQSGQLLEITSLAKHCGITRPTVMQYLDVLEVTHFVRMIRPFHGGGRREIIAQPKAYGFDTGFVCHYRGWEDLRPEDCGKLLEHVVLDTLRAHDPGRDIHYWRDKEQREMDFILPEMGGGVTAIECKWSGANFNPKNLEAFRQIYPKGRNVVVVGQTGDDFARRIGSHDVRFCPVAALGEVLE